MPVGGAVKPQWIVKSTLNPEAWTGFNCQLCGRGASPA